MNIDTEKIILFLREVDKFKFMEREIYNSDGRKETNTDHSWHLAMFMLLLEKQVKDRIDILKAFKMILIHDLIEIYAGDTFAFDTSKLKKTKEKRELKAAEKLFKQLPKEIGEELFDLWKEYETAKTKTAKFVKALDRIQAMNQNVMTKARIYKEHKIPYNLVKDYKKEYTQSDKLLKEISSELLKELKPYF
jgi:putative hydrolases of HD superfamily